MRSGRQKAAILGVVLVAAASAACTRPATKRHAYSCPDGYEFTIAYSDPRDAGDVAVLADASGTLELPRAPAASGVRYTNESTVFWSKGDQAMIEKTGEVRHQNCTT